MPKFKVTRIVPGCYKATYGDEVSYIEKCMDRCNRGLWQTDCSDSLFGSYAEARAYTEVVLTENAEY